METPKRKVSSLNIFGDTQIVLRKDNISFG